MMDELNPSMTGYGQNMQDVGCLPAMRTPDARFADLVEWPYAPRYIDDLAGTEGLRLHYIDEGGAGPQGTLFCLHGQRTWGYAFRKLIPLAVARGYRVVAMDYYGFGRSDKPVREADYDFTFHRNTAMALLERLGLDQVTVVGFDWGGWIGSTLPMDLPGRVTGLILGNMTHQLPGPPHWSGFHLWLASHNAQRNPRIGGALAAFEPGISEAALAGFEAPFPDSSYKAGVRRFPNLIPHRDETEAASITRRAQAYLANSWQGRCHLIAGAQDKVLGPRSMNKLAKLIRNAASPIILENSGPLVFEHCADFVDQVL